MADGFVNLPGPRGRIARWCYYCRTFATMVLRTCATLAAARIIAPGEPSPITCHASFNETARDIGAVHETLSQCRCKTGAPFLLPAVDRLPFPNALSGEAGSTS